MEPHSIVVVSLHTPKERIWGELVELQAAGLTVRGIDLNGFDDFIIQVMDPEGERIGLPTLFFPMQRVERVASKHATRVLSEPVKGRGSTLADVTHQHRVRDLDAS